jgi:hypothetical protein
MLKQITFGDTIYIFDSSKMTMDQVREELHKVYPSDNLLDKDEHPEEELVEGVFGNGISGFVEVVTASHRCYLISGCR